MYWKNQQNEVTVVVHAKKTSSIENDELIAVLPAGFRPAFSVASYPEMLTSDGARQPTRVITWLSGNIKAIVSHVPDDEYTLILTTITFVAGN